MRFNRNKIFFTILSGLLVIACFNTLNINKTTGITPSVNTSVLGVNDDTTVILNSFDDFGLVMDDIDIESYKFEENITFIYDGASNNWMDDKEKYKFEFTDSVGMGLIYNCTDFDIRVDFQHSTTASYWGDMQLILGTYYPNFSEFVADGSSVCVSGIGDAWESSGGVHHIAGYPDNVGDQYQSAYCTLSAAGKTTIHMIRTGSTFICEILEDDSIVLSHTWTDGMNQPINYISIYMYSGTTIPNFDNYAENLWEFLILMFLRII